MTTPEVLIVGGARTPMTDDVGALKDLSAIELRRRGKTRGLATACIGGGQGIAAIIETCN